MPSLVDLLQVIGSLGVVVGACICFFLPAAEDRQIAENVALGAALGGVVGAIIAFALFLGIAVGGGY